MKLKGSELEFISLIKRDGSGTKPVGPRLLELEQETEFTITGLSLTLGTYIASETNCYVVKKKNDDRQI